MHSNTNNEYIILNTKRGHCVHPLKRGLSTHGAVKRNRETVASHGGLNQPAMCIVASSKRAPAVNHFAIYQVNNRFLTVDCKYCLTLAIH